MLNSRYYYSYDKAALTPNPERRCLQVVESINHSVILSPSSATWALSCDHGSGIDFEAD